MTPCLHNCDATRRIGRGEASRGNAHQPHFTIHPPGSPPAPAPPFLFLCLPQPVLLSFRPLSPPRQNAFPGCSTTYCTFPAQGAPKVPQGDQRPDQDQAKTRPIAWSDLPSSCRQVYEALRQDAFLTYRGMVSKLGLNKDTINTAIGTLVRKGFIRREGNKQTGHWEVVK